MNVTITFKNRVESNHTRADGSAALSKDVLELNADGSAVVLWSRLEDDVYDEETKRVTNEPRKEVGYKREVLSLPAAVAVGPDGSLDDFWARVNQYRGVVEVEIDGKLVYPI